MRYPGHLPRAHMMHGETLLNLGEFARARKHCEQGLSLYDPLQRRSHVLLYGNDTGIGCRIILAQALWYLGYPDQAAREADELLVLARELSHPFTLVFALHFTAVLRQLCREPQIVREQEEAVIRISRERDFMLYLAVGMALYGWALAAQGRATADAGQVSAGIEQMQAGIATWRAQGGRSMLSHMLALLAEAYGLAGSLPEALCQIDEALGLVEASGERFIESELHRLKGDVLLTKGEVEPEAETCFQKALEVARRQGARSLELRAAVSLGRLWQGQGRVEEARDLLQGIYGWFSEGFDTADLQEAKALLDELSPAGDGW
jgi:predicted ATPase